LICAPEYFPGLDFLSRLCSGKDAILDIGQPYRRQTLQNRTKIRTPIGWQWLSIPVIKQGRGTPISEIQIDYSSKWVQDHLKGLRYNYATAPFYEHYIPSITEFLLSEHDNLSDLTVKTVIWSLNVLKLPVDVTVNKAPGLNLSGVHTVTVTAAPQNPEYRQNFPGFQAGMSVLDALFNHGPNAAGLVTK
jgi:hypothetical protein